MLAPFSPRLVDTGGAGDCFQAGLFVRLWQNGCLGSRKVHGSLGPEAMQDALEFADRVAAIASGQNSCNLL